MFLSHDAALAESRFSKPDYLREQAAVTKSERTPVDASLYMRRKSAIYGPSRSLSPEETVAGIVAKPEQVKPKSSLTVIGEAPEGFGQVLPWHPDDQDLAVIVFINPADFSGVLVTGVNSGDTVEVVSASGIASFAEDTQNEGVAGFITIVGAGANLTASIFGVPEIVPLLNAATAYAKEQWKEEKVRTKRRDAFGVDPGSGHKARQEGGVLIAMPAARGPETSGNDDNRDRWIKEPGDRVQANYPSQIKDMFFLSRSDRSRSASAAGDLYFVAWDYKFEDNFGFYRLNVLLKRGGGTLPVVE
jgi:hypothetical protein